MTYLETLFDLKDKVAVVTGGLGILGTQYCEALLKSGAKVAVIDINEVKSDHYLANAANGGALKFFKADITNRLEMEQALHDIETDWSTPEILINNAALDFPPSPGVKETFENYPLDKWNSVINVNLTGVLVCCQVFGGAMAQKNGGSIINISSIYGIVSPDQRIYKDFVKPVSYSVTKSGIINFTKYLATYWAAKNVRVNTLIPGGVLGSQDKGFIEKYQSKVPLNRMAQKDEYNGAILFLASRASSYMTGSSLVVDGGLTAW
ncbi:MAG: SDR family oxidoreductase [Candidatus Buchananbacteria bacterium]|nr:SDR family oxidoreductase [Candidatus Buchananbacteria bacterium]